MKIPKRRQPATAIIDIDSDNDFDIYSPIGYFSAYGPELKHTISSETEDELRQELILFLAKLEIRMPYVQEYDASRYNGHDGNFKHAIYEAIHQIATGGSIDYAYGGNRTLRITYIPSEILIDEV